MHHIGFSLQKDIFLLKFKSILQPIRPRWYKARLYQNFITKSASIVYQEEEYFNKMFILWEIPSEREWLEVKIIYLKRRRARQVMVCLYLYVIHELVSQLAVAEGGPSITETEATSLAGSRASTSRMERLERGRGAPPEHVVRVNWTHDATPTCH